MASWQPRIWRGVSVLLGVAMIAGGTAKLVGPAPIVESFVKWGLPDWFRVLVGTFELIGGVLLALNIPAIVKWIEHTFHVEFLSPDIYYISEVPSDLHWSDVGWVAAIAWVFCLIATLYPAWRAARTQPAAALRYE